MGKWIKHQKKKVEPFPQNNPVALLPIVSKVNLSFNQKLSSPQPNDRAWAASAISNLILDPETCRQLLNNQLTTSLLHLLSDSHDEIAMEGAGALRNLIIVQGETLCQELIQDRILHSLQLLAQKIASHLSALLGNSPSTYSTLNLKSSFNYAEQIMALVWCLLEVSNEALPTAMSMIPFMLTLLAPQTHAPFTTREVAGMRSRVLKTAGQCLMTLTEDNPDCSTHIQPDLLVLILTTPTEPMALRVLAAGILSNLSSNTHECIQTTMQCISQDWKAFMEKAQQVALALDSSPPTETVLSMDEMKQMGPQNAPAIDALESQLRYVQIALEILSNLFCQDVDRKSEEEWEDEDMDEEEEMMQEMEDVMDQELKEPPGLELLTQSSLLQTLFEMLSLSGPDNVTLSVVKEEWDHVRARCLGVFNNIFGFLGSSWVLDHTPFIQTLWTCLFQIGSTSDKDMLISVVETLWALCRILPPNTVQPTLEQTRGVIQLFETHPEMQTACVGILGYMGRCQGCVPLNQEIGQFLMAQLNSLAPVVETLAEILNALFDIYGDAAFDYDGPVFVQGGYLEQLNRLFPLLKTKIKSLDKRKHYQVRLRADEALVNLTAFISYKASESKKV